MAHPPGIYLGSQASPSENKECDIIWPHSELIIIPVSWNVNNSMKHSVSHLIKGSIRKVSVGSGRRLIDRVLALDAWGPKFDPQHRKKDDKEGRDQEKVAPPQFSVISTITNLPQTPKELRGSSWSFICLQCFPSKLKEGPACRHPSTPTSRYDYIPLKWSM